MTMMLITVWSSVTNQCLQCYKFNLVNKTVHSTVHCVGCYFLMLYMCTTHSLIPKPKATVICLGTTCGSQLDQHGVRLVRSLPIVVAKAYALHTT